MIIKNYSNLYWIYIHDNSNSVDNKIHDALKQLVTQSIVMKFGIAFNEGLRTSNESTKLMKEYNEIISHK